MEKSNKKQQKTKKTVKAISFMTRKQADNLQSKLRSAIKATTAVIEQKNLNPTHVKALKKYRKMLQDANNYFGWSVSTLAISK